MKKFLCILPILFFAYQPEGFSQFSRYIVQLKDKAGTPFTIADPIKFLSQRSVDRRTRYNIPVEETDLPITPDYIDSIRSAGNVVILNTSKWLNQVCILTTDATALSKINSFTFVKAAPPIGARGLPVNTKKNKHINSQPVQQAAGQAARPQNPHDVFDYGLAFPQVHIHNTEFLHNHGFKGETMHLAMMDAGFFNYQSLPTFDSMRKNNQVADTWDFVAAEASVNEDHAHGMNCLSTIAANLPGEFVGTAPQSKFYLYRTEDIASEYPVEEQNFAAAAERADSLGVDVFSVSLGYNTFDNSNFDYTYADLDGNTSISTRASDFAARKGILVVVAAGNDGNNAWHYLTVPADADSVLTVGAVNVARQPAGFSSFGPTSDGRIKPDVAAIGQGAVIANQVTGLPSYNNGTSFACPIMAGMATCLWQAFPEVNNMKIIEALRLSSDKVTTPDNRTGYGIPDAKKAFVFLLKSQFTKQVSVDNNCKATISWKVKSAANMNIVVERKLSFDLAYTPVSTQQLTGSFSLKDFSYTEDLAQLTPGPINYRLKMNIAADTSFYLDSVVVDNAQSCGALKEKISISPNPVTDNVTILIARSSPVKVSLVIHSSLGQVVYKHTQQSGGVQSFVIPMKKFSSGVYYLTVYVDDKKEITRRLSRQ